MHDSAHFQQMVEAAVEQALSATRADVTKRVMDAIAPALAPPDDVQRLAAALRVIESAFAQTDILGALLSGCGNFATRCALFVARGVSAPLWQSSGFGDGSSLRGVTAQVASGLGAQAMQSCALVQGNALEFDAHFLSVAGAPTNGTCVVLPLVVREKVAAIVYADAGQGGTCDADALEILVRAAGNRIELASTRKAPAAVAAPSFAAPAAPPVQPAPPMTVAPVQQAPMHQSQVAAVAAAPAMAPAPAVQPAAIESPAPVTPHNPAMQAQAAPAAPQASTDEAHVKARRFAKLLVEEIKLYNQQEVMAGRQAGDLYTRLREPIDKSREAYEKRYANTPVAAENYFTNELVRILADNNIALLGPNFPR
jgi:hypothetical protein